MEKKQLDLDAPLLSVRRFASAVASSHGVNKNKKKIEKSLPHRQQSLPVCKSDWELGEVTKPVAVPFLWEQIPGRPKGGTEAKAQSPVEPSNTPRFPPGRAFDISKQLLEEAYEDRNVFKPQFETSPLNDSATLWEKLKKRANAGDGDSESEDDEYSDAPDTLSPTETLSMKCSVSGLSGCGGSEVRPSGTFSADVQTRDFMMNRFLPAAKAMVLDTPQYVPKKQPTTPERPQLVRKVVSEEMRPLQQQQSAIVPRYGQSIEHVESEDEDNEYNNSRKKSVKARGLFSRFFLRNSFCLLNPVPGIKSKTPVLMPSAKEPNRLARTAYSGPLTQTADKHSWGAVNKKKLDSGAQSHELHKVKSKPTGESSRMCYSGDLRMMRGSSPYRGFSRGGISPYRSEAPPSPKVKAIKGNSNFQDVSCHQRNGHMSGPITPTVEKTLYIDSINNVELPISASISSREESLKDFSGKDLATFLDSSRMEETAAAESLIQDIRCLDTFEGGIIPTALGGSVDADRDTAFARASNARSQADRMEDLKHDQRRDQQLGSSDCLKLNTNRNLDNNNEHVLKEDKKNTNVSSMLSPLPPPLPKSPSESWLWRTLPSISLGQPFSRAGLGTNFHPKKQRAKASNVGTKWETIVKTSNVHHDHVRYSEELVPHVSPHSKT